MKRINTEVRPIALERPVWYWKDKVVSLTVWMIGTIGGLLFLVPALKFGGGLGSDVVVLLLAGAGILLCGILGLLSFVSRHRIAVLEDRLILPWQFPLYPSEVRFHEMKRKYIRRDSAGWVFVWETESGRRQSLRVTGLDNPQVAIELLTRVAAST